MTKTSDEDVALGIKALSEEALKSRVVWLQHMASGRTIDLSNPDAGDIRLSDICRGLSRIRRWSGQAGIISGACAPGSDGQAEGDFDFSVGQHVLSTDDSIEEVIAANPDAPQDPDFARRLSRHLTVHDMPETYTGDVITPLKLLLGPSLRAIETAFEHKIAVAINIPVEDDEVVLTWAKEIDVAASWAEMTLCFPLTAPQSRVRYTDRQVAIADIMRPHVAKRAKQDQDSVRRDLTLLALRHGARESINHKEVRA